MYPNTKPVKAEIIIVPSADKFITPLFSEIVSPITAIINGVLNEITVIIVFSKNIMFYYPQ